MDGGTDGKRRIWRGIYLVVVSDFGVSGQWEVFPKGVSLEAVVGEDAAEVGMVGEEDAVHVPHFPLVPGRGNDRRGLTLLQGQWFSMEEEEEDEGGRGG